MADGRIRSENVLPKSKGVEFPADYRLDAGIFGYILADAPR
jgi:hypothetical protein